MKLYAICWRSNEHEPWAPATASLVDDPPPQPFWWDRDEAVAALVAHQEALVRDRRETQPPQANIAEPVAVDWVSAAVADGWSVQEYDVPTPSSLAQAVREVVRLNDSADGAVGDVRAALGDEPADWLAELLREG